MKLTTRRLICYPSWNNVVPALTAPGWTKVPLLNLGNNQDSPNDKAYTNWKGPAIIDWEPPLPDLKKWATLLHMASPGDIAYGIDPGVNHPMYDRQVGLIAKALKLSGGYASMAYDIYPAAREDPAYWSMRVGYRLIRLRQIQGMNKTDSVVLVSPLDQHAPEPYRNPVVLRDEWLERIARAVGGDLPLSVCIFAGAASADARAVVDPAVVRLANMIDAAGKIGGVE